MKTYNYLIGFAALASLTLVGCSDNDFLGNDNGAEVAQQGNGEITFVAGNAKTTRAGEFIGATAAQKLGGMFVVEGTKGTEAADAPSSTVVFDNYLVGYTANSAGTTESNTNNWEYVGLESGITGRMTGGTGSTWAALHPAGTAQAQTVKYWDYSVDQYDFIAWSTGTCEAVTTAAAEGKVKVTRINTGNTLATDGFTLSAANANDLLQCYYTDINTVTKASKKYGQPVTLTFRNMAAKVRVALYETVPGYSIKDVKFYSADANPTAPADLGTGSSADNAVLFTMGGDVLPQSGDVLIYYPRIGKTYRDASPAQSKDYNKASVTVTPGSSASSTQTFGALTAQYGAAEASEATGDIYLGRTLPTATYAGDATKDFYTAVIPNTNGKPLTLRVDYTLVSTDGSKEEIKVYGAKAVVPATYTVWQPNYAYTYVFKISDNSNGWTSQTNTDPKGLFPITFDAVVTNFVDANAEQATITTVATPSITTYQQGHDPKAQDEYSNAQKAGVSTDVKDVYVQVMDNNGTPTLKADLNGENKSLLFAVTTEGAPISEATVMDALQNRTNAYNAASPKGRNGITLTTNGNISNTETQIVNGVDDQSITEIAGTPITAGQVAKIDIDQLDEGTYAYVYVTSAPSKDERVYNVAAATAANCTDYYEVKISDLTPASGNATDGKVYFVANRDAKNTIVSYTFKQTKVGDDVTDLFVATIPGSKAAAADFDEDNFYFDVYNKNNGAYAVKVIKVVAPAP
jgi:hypothetical protein